MHKVAILLLSNIFNRRSVITKISLGALCLTFLMGYQPTFGWPPVKPARVLADNQITQTIASNEAPVKFNLPHTGYVSTYYSKGHPGLDIAIGVGMPIHPIAAGVVTSAGYNFWGLGLAVEVDHGNGYKSIYGHMSKIITKTGATVTTDDMLGQVGMTGNTSGPHTHLELIKNGHNIDPLTVLPSLPDISSAWNNSQIPTGGSLAK